MRRDATQGAKNPGAGSTPTSVSRAAQMALTKVLANEVFRKKIEYTVYIRLGLIDTID
jgi:hypothetical protein